MRQDKLDSSEDMIGLAVLPKCCNLPHSFLAVAHAPAIGIDAVLVERAA